MHVIYTRIVHFFHFRNQVHHGFIYMFLFFEKLKWALQTNDFFAGKMCEVAIEASGKLHAMIPVVHILNYVFCMVIILSLLPTSHHCGSR